MKINSQAYQLLLLTAVLMTALFSQPALAQEREEDLALTLLPYYHDATAGKDNLFYLEVRNTGSKAVTNIRLSADKPEDWIIDFEPEEIAHLAPGSIQTVDVSIKPPWSAAKRGHNITFIAQANELVKVEGFWVTVKTTPFWPWIGAGVVIVVVAAFIFIFIRSGRQK